MNITKIKITTAFFITFSAAILAPTLFPWLHLIYFAPFLVILYYKKTLIPCLWWSISCGILIDLLTSKMRFGIHAINYVLTTFLLYKQRRNYFADSISTLPIMTFFFVILSTIIQVGLLTVFGQKPTLSFGWVITDLVVLPIFDVTFALIAFTLPRILFGKPQRKGKDYFMEKE